MLSPLEALDEPLRISSVAGEIVFLGRGPIAFSMTPGAARLTLLALTAELERLAASPPVVVVLIVEDDPIIREVGAAVLADAGYVVVEVGDASDALKVLESGRSIDLMVTDVHMPGALNGLELAHLVYHRWPAVGLLLCSGQCLPTAEQLPAGGRFLSKPYVENELLRHVQELAAA